MTLKITPGIDVTAEMIHASDIAEDDEPVYSSGTTYSAGQRSMKDHMIYESAKDNNSGNDPSIDSGENWLTVGPTNRFAAFALDRSNVTSKNGGFYWEIDLDGLAQDIHLIGIKADSIRVKTTRISDSETLFDSGTSAVGRVIRESNWWSWFYGERDVINRVTFDDIRGDDGVRLRIEVNSESGEDASVQAIVIGSAVRFGLGVQYGLRFSMDAGARVTRDKFGNLVIQRRARADRNQFSLLVRNSEIDDLRGFLAENRGRIMYWNADSRWRATQILGVAEEPEATMRYFDGTEFQFSILGVAIE